MHVKSASDTSAAIVEDSSGYATWHHRRQSSATTQYNCYYYVQSPTTLDSSGSTRVLPRDHSVAMSGNNIVELPPIYDEEGGDDDHEWEKMRRRDSAPLIEGGCRNGLELNEADYYGGLGRGSECSCFCRGVAAVVAVCVAALVVVWGMGRTFHPRILVQDIVFIDLNIQEGVDLTGVPMEMISVNSTVRISYKKSTTFYGIHFSSSPLLLDHYGLKVASGQMEKLYQSRKRRENTIIVVVQGKEMPMYGGLQYLATKTQDLAKVKIGLNLTFSIRARANILGRLIKYKLYKTIRCPITLDGARLGLPVHLTHSCIYQ